ncbi:hypothetical protein SAMN05443662_1283 [Sulfurivirga caldicuralii]|uniref:Uncharacterized protein n=1 Tax=Sulfurivirga caldicuralii TaxID=364032 RepID=A0A1N6GCM9_9GAMM|nr:hypothetical protein [Sulfurivirga caldicuralii]SIO05192.1 hypothetical protein SAMN05443662_1283 [Sulfurivirga caldicuralii]
MRGSVLALTVLFISNALADTATVQHRRDAHGREIERWPMKALPTTFNRNGRPFSWQLVKETILRPPVTGSIRNTV